MSNNISKYVQLNDFILLEYEFCKSDSNIKNINKLDSVVLDTSYGGKQYLDTSLQADTNNTFGFVSIPMDSSKSNWLSVQNYNTLQTLKVPMSKIKDSRYNFDRIKIHIVSGYHFQDCDGFLLKLKAKRDGGGYSTLSNFSWTKNISDQYNKQLFFSNNPITLSNKRYDKYILLEVPSVYDLGTDLNKDTEGYLANIMGIKKLADIDIEFGFIPYGMVSSDINSTYVLNENIVTSFPVVSLSDNFNCFIKESSSGDYIEYYATWLDSIIGRYINDIETGIIPLYTSNNPNDNYMDFEEIWGHVARKWVVTHDLEVIEHIGISQSLVTQRMSMTQDSNFDFPNYFRPIIINSDTVNSVTIIYTCKLQNRMDGSQIVRKSSFNLTEPKKYGKTLSRLNVGNVYNFKVNNVIDKQEVVQNTISKDTTRYVKVYYDTTKVVLDEKDAVYEQGTGKVHLKRGGSVIRLDFSRIMRDESKQNVDLSGVFTYRLRFPMKDGSYVDVAPTNSKNMNMALGQLEFNISDANTSKILNQGDGVFMIQIKNPDKSFYTFYQGVWDSYNKK